MIFFLMILDIFLKITNSFILTKVIKSVIDSEKNDAYFWSGMLTLCSFVITIIRHNSWNKGLHLSWYYYIYINLKLLNLYLNSIKNVNILNYN